MLFRLHLVDWAPAVQAQEATDCPAPARRAGVEVAGTALAPPAGVERAPAIRARRVVVVAVVRVQARWAPDAGAGAVPAQPPRTERPQYL
jgi:hypothetical protein